MSYEIERYSRLQEKRAALQAQLRNPPVHSDPEWAKIFRAMREAEIEEIELEMSDLAAEREMVGSQGWLRAWEDRE